jgi:hypothetical protein
MYLYDDITPPLVDNSYRVDVVTNVTYNGTAAPLSTNSGYFDIVGPRFTLPDTDVAGVFPPRNGHGGFDETIPQIAIFRRTLPWERRLTSDLSLIGTPTRDANTPQPNPFPLKAGVPQEYGPAPWPALLLFEEGEYTLHKNVLLKSVMPAAEYARLEVSDGITCDSIEVEDALLQSVLPSLDELTLPAHVRQVNVDDRELDAGSSDGYFAIVMGNRMPAPGAKFRACLVSLEERTDLVKADPPAVAPPAFTLPVFTYGQTEAPRDSVPRQTLVNAQTSTILETVADRNVGSAIGFINSPIFGYQFATQKVVLLYSWTFECTGAGTFRDYVQRINVSMMGTVEEQGHPPVTDTGHVPITVLDRAGVEEDVWYRGPLVPLPLTRDPLTYHSADQCRRVTPETGAEDVSYAAAFEAGRMMAAADARLAQELMRWRRESYRQSVRTDSLNAIQLAIPLNQTLDIHQPVAPVVAVGAATTLIGNIHQIGDRYGLGAVNAAPGLDPLKLQSAWNLGSVAEATAILGGEPGATGVVVTSPAQTPRPAATLASVAADTASLNHLQSARDRLLTSVQLKLET